VGGPCGGHRGAGGCREALDERGPARPRHPGHIDADRHRLVIADDGGGFDPTKSVAGFGLSASVAGRMAHLGGQAVIDSAPGAGTRVELCWSEPIPRRAAIRTG
jgi:two-component sensor histidine kinase